MSDQFFLQRKRKNDLKIVFIDQKTIPELYNYKIMKVSLVIFSVSGEPRIWRRSQLRDRNVAVRGSRAMVHREPKPRVLRSRRVPRDRPQPRTRSDRRGRIFGWGGNASRRLLRDLFDKNGAGNSGQSSKFAEMWFVEMSRRRRRKFGRRNGSTNCRTKLDWDGHWRSGGGAAGSPRWCRWLDDGCDKEEKVKQNLEHFTPTF